MNFDFFNAMKSDNTAIRLLRADNMPMIAGFLYESFIQSDIQTISYEKLIIELDYYLNEIRLISGKGKYTQTAKAYIDEWISDDGFLRKYRDDNSDEAICDLAAPAEKAIRWMEMLKDRQFVGTESRLKIVLELLDDLLQGTMESPEDKIVRLQNERDQINKQIMLLKAGESIEMSETEIKEKAILLEENVRTLVGDFREVEGNFRRLSKETRLRLADSENTKGLVLDEILDEHNSIRNSDEGRSFEGFFELLMRSDLQQKLGIELKNLLDIVESKDIIEQDTILSGLSSKMLNSAYKIHQTRMQINEQIARFIQETHGENKRLGELISEYKKEIKDITLDSSCTLEGEIRGVGFKVNPTMSLQLYRPDIDADVVDKVEVVIEDDEVDLSPLLDVTTVDEAVLIDNIQQCLTSQSQVKVSEIVEQFPIKHGLEEALTYLKIATEKTLPALINESSKIDIIWADDDGNLKSLSMPIIIFTRGLSS